MACLLCLSLLGGIVSDDDILNRGDANHDGFVDSSDAAFIASWLYSGGPEPPCLNEADVNHDGSVDGSDPVYLTNWLFNGGPPPPAPGPGPNGECSDSEEPFLSCDSGC